MASCRSRFPDHENHERHVEMSASEEIYDDVFREMDGFADKLYQDAEVYLSREEDDLEQEELSPMYEALCRIEDRYETLELIATGGMKEIYRVHDRRAVRDVALAKPLEKIKRADYDAFLREAHLTARLEHPSIIKLFNMGVAEDGRPFFTMELKRGRSLREIIRSLRKGREGEQYPLSRRLEIILRVCEALAYAHSCRVLHLDIKPENIQVGIFGEVQVCDWGMGVVMPDKGDRIKDSEVLLDPDLYGPLLLHADGTPGYMAPEQKIPREPKSERMDIYALGCLLQELVTLRPPEDSFNPDKMSDPVLSAIISKARNPHSGQRYPSVIELQQDISRFLRGYSTSVEHAGFFRESTLFYRRNRKPCLITFALLTVMVIGTGFFVNTLRQSRNAAEVAQARAEKALEDFLREKAAAEARLRADAVLADSVIARVTRREFVDTDLLPLTVEQARLQIKAITKEAPPSDSPIWRRLFWLNFLVQDFDAALEIVAGGHYVEHYGPLIPFARKYAPYIQEGHLLPVDRFIELLSDLYRQDKKRHALMEQMMIYDAAMGRSMMEQQAVVRSLLSLTNPDATDPEMKFESDSRKIVISGAGVRILRLGGTGRSYLRVFDPLFISIAGTDIDNLHELKGLRLYELDIRNTGVKIIKPLADMHSLRRLIVSPGQLNPENRALLSDYVEIVER